MCLIPLPDLSGRFINAPREGGTEQQKAIPSMAASALDSPDAADGRDPRQSELPSGSAASQFGEGPDRRPLAFSPLHRLVEEQAKRAPDAGAVIWGDATWSYRTLMARAAQVSAYLQAAQVGKGGLVAVLLPRRPTRERQNHTGACPSVGRGCVSGEWSRTRFLGCSYSRNGRPRSASC